MTKEHIFIQSLIKLFNSDDPWTRKTRANLKRIDNPNLEFHGWEFLSEFVDLTNDDRSIYALIAASFLKNDRSSDGKFGIGRAIALCYLDSGEKESEQAQMKLRRLLACRDKIEILSVLRPILSLIRSKSPESLSHSDLIKDLLYFSPEKTPAKWAEDFYKISVEEE
jgi:CRISPR system Cascade subunit CasB